VRRIGKAVGWTLRLFGSPGARLATWLGSKLTAVKQAAIDRVRQLQRLSGLLRPQNLPAKAVAAIARERLLRALVGRFLPRPWSWLVRIVANIALLPTAVLRDAGTVVAGVVPGMHPTPAPTPDGRTSAATDPAPTAAVPTVVPAAAPAAPTTRPPAGRRRPAVLSDPNPGCKSLPRRSSPDRRTTGSSR